MLFSFDACHAAVSPPEARRCIRLLSTADRFDLIPTVRKTVRLAIKKCSLRDPAALRHCSRMLLKQCRQNKIDCTTTTTSTTEDTTTSTTSTSTVATTTTTTTSAANHGTTTTTTSTIATTTTTRPPLDAFLGSYFFTGNRTSGPCGILSTTVDADAVWGELGIHTHDVTTMNGNVGILNAADNGRVFGGFVIGRRPGWPTWETATNSGTCGIFLPPNPPPIVHCGNFHTSMTGFPTTSDDVPGAVWVSWETGCDDRWDGYWSLQTTVTTTTSTPTTSTIPPDFDCTTTTTVAAVTTTTQPPDCAGPISAYVQTYSFTGQLTLDECGSIPPTPWFVVPPPLLEGRLHIDTIGADRRTLAGDLWVQKSCSSVYSFGISGRIQGEKAYPEWQVASDLTPFEEWEWVPSGTRYGKMAITSKVGMEIGRELCRLL
jgi:hypothetical protein